MSPTKPEITTAPGAITRALRATAISLMRAVDEAQTALSQFDAPTLGLRLDLGPGESTSDWGDEGNVPHALICPWCKEVVRADALYDRELAERLTYASEIDAQAEEVRFHYDGGSDFNSIVLVHEACKLPVRLPDGWERHC